MTKFATSYLQAQSMLGTNKHIVSDKLSCPVLKKEEEQDRKEKVLLARLHRQDTLAAANRLLMISHQLKKG